MTTVTRRIDRWVVNPAKIKRDSSSIFVLLSGEGSVQGTERELQCGGAGSNW